MPQPSDQVNVKGPAAQSRSQIIAGLNQRAQAQGLEAPIAPEPTAAAPTEPTPTPVAPPLPAAEPAPAPVASDPAADILSAVGLSEPAKPAAPAAPADPKDKDHNFAELRRQLKEREAESKRIADEKEALQAEHERLLGELTKRDLTFDPKFEENYVRPVVERLSKAKDMAKRFAVEEGEVERMLRMSGPDFSDALDKSKFPSLLKQHLTQTYMDVSDIEDRKQVALTNARQTQEQYADARRREQLSQLSEMTVARDQTFAQAVRNRIQGDTTGMFVPKQGVSTADEVKAELFALKDAISPPAGVPPVAQFHRQVDLMHKGVAFDRAMKRAEAAEARLQAVLAEAKRLNISIPISEGSVTPSAPPASVAGTVKNPSQLVADLRSGKFSAGGELDRFGNRV